MRLSEVPEGTVVRVGHPVNMVLAARGRLGWTYLSSGSPVPDEDFRAGWELYVPSEVLAELSPVEYEYSGVMLWPDGFEIDGRRRGEITSTPEKVFQGTTDGRETRILYRRRCAGPWEEVRQGSQVG
jgi:hypothetical protein